MRPLRTLSELNEAIDQAIFEFNDLSICTQEDLEEELYDYLNVFNAMAEALKMLKSDLNGRSEYTDSRGLVFMNRAVQLRFAIPFFSLIEAIDSACRQGVRDI